MFPLNNLARKGLIKYDFQLASHWSVALSHLSDATLALWHSVVDLLTETRYYRKLFQVTTSQVVGGMGVPTLL